MAKINLETFKKLLNVKKGGAEFFRLVVKIAATIFIFGAMFYGLMYIPNKNLKIQKQIASIKSTELNIAIQSVDTQCKLAGQNIVAAEKVKAKKADKKIDQKTEQNIFVNTYINCVNLHGMSFLAPQPKQAKKELIQKKK